MNPVGEAAASFEWTLLQRGSLPLRPRGDFLPMVDHACAVALVWPAGEPPREENSLLVDPCFVGGGLRRARRLLEARGIELHRIGSFFVTHPHGDHRPSDLELESVRWRPFEPGSCAALRGLEAVPCPGHHRELRALRFRAGDDEVWVVGDAILDEAWLRAWKVYWPNGYADDEIAATWRSVARILASADLVVPGHGRPLRVTAELISALLESFPAASQAARCGDVVETLRRRLTALEA